MEIPHLAESDRQMADIERSDDVRFLKVCENNS